MGLHRVAIAFVLAGLANSALAASVSGTVNGKDGGSQEGAVVVAIPLDALPDLVDIQMRVTTSALNGSFEFRNLPPGEWRLSATAKGLAPALSERFRLSKPASRTVMAVELVASRSWTISGTVTDGAGKAISKVRVLASHGDAHFVTFSDATGRYTIAVNRDAEWAVSAQHEGFASRSVSVFGPTNALDFTLLKAATVSGTVVRHLDSRPVPFAEVRAIPLHAHGWEEDRRGLATIADKFGRFSLETLRPAEYFLSARAGSLAGMRGKSVRLAAGENVQSVEVRVVSAPSVTGKLIWKDWPPSDREIVRLDSAESRHHRTALEARVGLDGTFRFDGVLPDNYSLFAMDEDYTVEESVVVSTSNTFVQHEMWSGGRLKEPLEPLETVGGVVLDDATGEPLSGIPVLLEDTSRRILHTMSGKDGQFEFKNVARGEVTVVASRTADFSPRRRTTKSSLGSVSGDTKVILRIAKNAGTIRGVVRDRKQRSVANAEITAVGDTDGDTRFALSGEDGGFELRDLADCDYTVVASAEGFRDWNVGLAFSEAEALEVKETQRVSLRVLAPDKEPVRSFRVLSGAGSEPITIHDPAGNLELDLSDDVGDWRRDWRITSSGLVGRLGPDPGIIHMSPAPSLRGRIIDDLTGTAMAGARVTVMALPNANHTYADARTDQNGEFEVRGILTGLRHAHDVLVSWVPETEIPQCFDPRGDIWRIPVPSVDGRVFDVGTLRVRKLESIWEIAPEDSWDVGIAFESWDGRVRISEVRSGSRAAKAGLLVDQPVLKVNGLDASSYGARSLSVLMSQPRAKSIELTLGSFRTSDGKTISERTVRISR